MDKLKDGTAVIRRDRPYETAEWLASERSEFRSHRFKAGQWWVNVAVGDEPADWIREDESQMRSDLWNILSGQAEPRLSGNPGDAAFHPRKADVDEIMDALRAYLFDSEGQVPDDG